MDIMDIRSEKKLLKGSFSEYNRLRYFLLSALFCFGCHLKLPTPAEQSELVKRGTYPNGVPPWISSTVLGAVPGKRLNMGFIPTSFEIHDPSLNDSTKLHIVEPPTDTPASKTSALERIALQCPTIEKQVVEALTTVESLEQIERYEALIRRCSHSSDLWYLCGVSYEQAGYLSKARQAFARALSLNSGNQDARSKLDGPMGVTP